MKWLEIIEIRSSPSTGPLLETQLKGLMNKKKTEVNNQTLRLYKLIAFGTDFSIHLVHDTEEFNASGSFLGQHLSATFKEFGLVNHSVWVEMELEEQITNEKNS